MSRVIRLRPINGLDGERPTRFRLTGERRPPRRGEWYTEHLVRDGPDTAVRATKNHRKRDWKTDPLPDLLIPVGQMTRPGGSAT